MDGSPSRLAVAAESVARTKPLVQRTTKAMESALTRSAANSRCATLGCGRLSTRTAGWPCLSAAAAPFQVGAAVQFLPPTKVAARGTTIRLGQPRANLVSNRALQDHLP
jgi:hypothetical protein